MNTDYDLIIAGGGMVGAALAAHWARPICVLPCWKASRSYRIRPETTLDLRVSAISRASQRIFAAIGAWESMTAWRVSPFRDMRVWDATGFGQIHFDSADYWRAVAGLDY
jgi:2-octaprenylphenol hydroxylase